MKAAIFREFGYVFVAEHLGGAELSKNGGFHSMMTMIPRMPTKKTIAPIIMPTMATYLC